jgi:hypothetical protein
VSGLYDELIAPGPTGQRGIEQGVDQRAWASQLVGRFLVEPVAGEGCEEQGDARDEYVGAGIIYLLLSAVLFLFWLSVDHVLVLFMALSTVVAGLVDLAVGWPRFRRGLATRLRVR